MTDVRRLRFHCSGERERGGGWGELSLTAKNWHTKGYNFLTG